MSQRSISRVTAVLAGITAMVAGVGLSSPVHAEQASQSRQDSYQASYGPTSTSSPATAREARVPDVAMTIAEAFASRDPERIERVARRHTVAGSDAHKYVRLQALVAEVDRDADVYIEQHAYQVSDGVAVCWTPDGLDGPCARFTNWATDTARASSFQVNGEPIGPLTFGQGQSDRDYGVQLEFVAYYQSNVIVRVTNHRFAPVDVPELNYRVDGRETSDPYIVAPGRIEARDQVLIRLCPDASFGPGGTILGSVEDIGAELEVPISQ